MQTFFRPAVLCLFGLAFISGSFIAEAADNKALTLPNPLEASKNTLATPKASAIIAAPPSIVPSPPDIDAKAFVLMDASSGQILAQKGSEERLPPASLTKLMTLYLIFQALENKQITLSDQVYISEKAWRMGGSKMFIRVGNKVPLQMLVQGIAVASGNDACVAMAEHLGGSESVFVQMMNQAAARLGMKGTHFTDSNGLPDANHYTTAKDMAILARAIITDFPKYYPYFGEKWFIFNKIRQPNRNRLLWRDSSVDGLKTGHTQDAGFCLVASAKRDNMRLISVVLNAPSDSSRAADSEALLNYGFRFYRAYQLFDSNKALAKVRTWYGKNKFTELGLSKPLTVTIPNVVYKQLKPVIQMKESTLEAPVTKDQVYGQIQVTLKNQVIVSAPLIALQDNPRGNWGSRLGDRIGLMIHRWFN